MKCPKCQTDNPEINKFCRQCGTKLEHVCPQCGAEVLVQDRFCGICGHNLTIPSERPARPLSFDEKIAKIQRYLPEGLTEKILSQRDRIEGERKQVTVMFCDMEGFTPLTERLGPEEAYSVMDDVYEILIHKVHDYGGTVNEMTGDGIMALFGAPIALEDGPQRAIRSAMAIHREMTRFSDSMTRQRIGIPSLKMRIGIHTGPVVVGTLGNDLRVEFKAVGDTVNLACRMEQLARPGTTYVTKETFKLTEGLFRFEALGERQVKGKEGAIQVYQVIAPSTRRTRFDVSAERGLTPFVGRDRELEILLDGFAEVKASRGQAFSIISEAGVGKSRLLYEFRKAVANEDVTFLEGRSLSYSRGVVYHPVIDMLKANFEIREEDRASEITRKVKDGLRGLGADEPSTLPHLLDLLSVQEDGAERIGISPEARKERIIESLKTIVLRGSAIRPLILTFEDLHWVDKSSEDVFRMLLESIAGARVLLIFTYRPEFVQAWGGKSYHSQLNLNRLSNREALAMVTHLLGTNDIQTNLAELILQKTEGIPFFIEEFVRSLTEQKIIGRRDNRCHLAKDIQEVAIPSTIQDVIMARIDKLPEHAKEVLQTGSVIDREFSYNMMRRVSGLHEKELIALLSGLKDTELLYERGIFPNTTYTFKHALTQEVAYNALLLKRREELHGKIGRAIEELYSERLEEYYELLAHHYTRSENREKAVEYLHVANQKAARAYGIEAAKAYFDDAMRLLDAISDTEANQERRISLLVNQILVFEQLGQLQEYYEILRRYETIAVGLGKPGLLGSFYSRMGFCEMWFGWFDTSIQTSTEAAKLSETGANFEDAGLAYCVMEHDYAPKGDFDLVFDMEQNALRMMGKAFHLQWYTRAVCGASLAYSNMGRWDEALGAAQNAIHAAERVSDNAQIAYAAWIVSYTYGLKGDLGRALEYGKVAVEKTPLPAHRAMMHCTLAWIWGLSGEINKGLELLAEFLPTLLTNRFVLFELVNIARIAEVYWKAGEYDTAKQTAEDALEIAKRCRARYYIGSINRILGQIVSTTKPDEATHHLEEAICISQEIKAENELALAYSGMGRLHKQRGEYPEARRYLTQALEIFERLGTLLEPDKVRKELAEL